MSNEIFPEKFLLPEDDGLVCRASQPYAIEKLKAVYTYINIMTTSMRNKPWRARFYIDLQAGPGKNKIGSQYHLGSPLIALTTEHSFTHYRFNEWDDENNSVLRQRVDASPLKEKVNIYQQDVNKVVFEICAEIDRIDNSRDFANMWSSLNLAFLDPEGLELHWETVERLAKIRKMDMIINFSTSGILRNIGKGNLEIVNTFFGTEAWQQSYRPTANATAKRRILIDFYLQRLQQFGYHTDVDPDIVFKNSNNVQVYSLIFASKNELGDKFWQQAAKEAKPPKLPGF